MSETEPKDIDILNDVNWQDYKEYEFPASFSMKGEKTIEDIEKKMLEFFDKFTQLIQWEEELAISMGRAKGNFDLCDDNLKKAQYWSKYLNAEKNYKAMENRVSVCVHGINICVTMSNSIRAKTDFEKTISGNRSK